jgi:hypothetical protein
MEFDGRVAQTAQEAAQQACVERFFQARGCIGSHMGIHIILPPHLLLFETLSPVCSGMIGIEQNLIARKSQFAMADDGF